MYLDASIGGELFYVTWVEREAKLRSSYMYLLWEEMADVMTLETLSFHLLRLFSTGR